MRLVLLLLLTPFLAAGCGQTSGVGSGPGSGPGTGGTEELTAPTTGMTTDDDRIGPPAVLLESTSGVQRGKLGSWCVQNPSAGSGACADAAAVAPDAVSVVAPGEELTLRLAGARFVRNQDCQARDMSCVGEASIVIPGCARREVARVFLEPGQETQFRAPSGAGRYEIRTFANFEADDGRSGDVAAVFGLRVEADAEPGVDSANDSGSEGVCR